ncbi:uncharacterized protein LOC143287775 [Babylonia areolata]|uniref:uncharacterized protein LOC143287775 n=1 Tax=Babylonia areolata TaxID=304850 RepID=UPI003FD47E92
MSSAVVKQQVVVICRRALQRLEHQFHVFHITCLRFFSSIVPVWTVPLLCWLWLWAGGRSAWCGTGSVLRQRRNRVDDNSDDDNSVGWKDLVAVLRSAVLWWNPAGSLGLTGQLMASVHQVHQWWCNY